MAIALSRLTPSTRELFVTQLKESFDAFATNNPNVGCIAVITREEIEASLDHPGSKSYWALAEGERVGGIVITVDRERAAAEIELLFVVNGRKNADLGAQIVRTVESMYPKVEVWSLYTPNLETRNIHFYVNKCGYKIVEFFHPGHPMALPQGQPAQARPSDELFFRFEKRTGDIPRRS